ncbi:CHAT domain-containing protein [Cyathus striatus]|nr:CHAT domain-containing protein [Cyathus striatus]
MSQTETAFTDPQTLRGLYELTLKLPDDDVSKPLHLLAVGTQCYASNQQLNSLDVSEWSIQAFQLAVILTPQHDQEMRISLLSLLSLAFMQHYDLSQCVEDLNQAVSTLREGVDLTPENHPSLPDQLAYLGYAFRTRFEQTKELRDITEVIDIHRMAAFLTSEGSRSRFESLFNLSYALHSRFDHTHELSDADEAIEIMHDLVNNMNPEDPQYSLLLNCLACTLEARFDYSGDLRDARQAINVQCKTVENRPNDPSSLMNLGKAHAAYFMQTRELPHVHMAVEALRKALSLAGDDPLPGILINLGVSLGLRFLATGNIDDLEEAIALEQRGIQICRDDDPILRQFYSDLGNLFYFRSALTEDLRDMHEGARAHREGVIRTPIGHRDLPGLLNNLGNSTKRLFLATGNEAYLSEAISRYKEAVALTLDDSIGQMDHLSNLGGAFCSRYMLAHQQSDLDDGLSALRKSVTLYPPDHAQLPNNLLRLAGALEILFKNEHQLETIDEAISVMEWAIDITPEGDARLPSLLDLLGGSFFHRYNTTHSNDDIERAVSLCRQATQMPVGSPLTRLSSGRQWGLLSLLVDPEQALHAFEIIFNDVVPQLAWIGRTMEQRYLLLETLANIVSEATAVAIRYGQLHTAVEWLEQGRSIVWNQVNSFRSPLDDLRKVNPALCMELEKIGIALEEASMRTNSSDLLGSSMLHNISIQDDVLRHQGLAKQWDSLLCQVRSISGFEKFLCPIPFFELVVTLPPSGLVIVVNADSFSCDALALTRGISADRVDVFTVPLPRFYEKAVILRERLHRLLSDPSTRTRTVRAGRTAPSWKTQFSIKDILRELWYEIVKPIIDALNLEPTSNPPRIWWSPTGPLAFLPLHAAGDYYQHDKTPSSGSNIMDYAISSYTPTITALTQSISKHNQQKSRQPQEFKGLLTVSEPEAPDLPTIPSTALESCALKKLFDSFSYTLHSLDGVEATVKNVSDAMPLYNWIHLSCHALQNDSPLKSAFYLHDGELSLSDIIKKPLPHSQFAFLSACETGKGDEKLSEEAIHLAAGMLAAGYTSVVATMWSISDIHAPQVSEEFYSYILQKEDESSMENSYPDCTRAAAALHHAIGKFRHLIGDDEDSLLLWVPYIHVGI